MIGRLLGLVTGGSGLWWAAGIAAALVAGYVAWSQVALANRATEIASLSARAQEAERVAKANSDALEVIQARHATEMAAVAADVERARRAARGVTVIKQEIARAPDAAARVCEPVDRFLGLLQGGAPVDGGPRRGGNDPGAAAVVR